MDLSFFVCQAAKGAQGGGMGSFLILIPLFGLMYFLMIRPQKKKQQEHQRMLSQVKAGDKVMLSCGLYGKVASVSDKTVKVSCNGTQLEFAIGAVADIIQDETAIKADAAIKEEKK